VSTVSDWGKARRRDLGGGSGGEKVATREKKEKVKKKDSRQGPSSILGGNHEITFSKGSKLKGAWAP